MFRSKDKAPENEVFKRKMKFSKIILLAVLLSQGCTPWPMTERPKLNMLVLDVNGIPIENANVSFAIYKEAMTPTLKIIKLKTNHKGNVNLKRSSYIQMIALAPDGGHFYDWSYCIEKSGYHPVFKNTLTEKYFKKGLIVEKLLPAKNNEQCFWQKFPHGYLIK